MLRKFSNRRVIGSFLFDWSISLVLFTLSAYLRENTSALSLLFSAGLGAAWEAVSLAWPYGMLNPYALIELALIWPIVLIGNSVYNGQRNESLVAELLNLTRAISLATLVMAGVLFMTFRGTSRAMFVIFYFLDMAVLQGSRVAWYVYRKYGVGRDRPALRRVIIVGAGEVGERVLVELEKFAHSNIRVAGFLDDDPEKSGASISGYPVLGRLDQAVELFKKFEVEEALIALPLYAHDSMIGISRALQEIYVRVYIIPDLFALSFPAASLEGFGGIPVIDLGLPGIQGSRRFFKRVFDLVGATLFIGLAWPIFLLIAVWIKLDSPGPVLYKQERVGENGKLFLMFKFRSMKQDASQEPHKEYATRLIRENIAPGEDLRDFETGTLKMKDDPRITRVGRFLRKTSLDELPQLFNVFSGEMSLVGPRPPMLYEVDVYQDWHKKRLEVPPGITGLWQVKARNQVSFDEMVRMDLEYIQRQNIWLDLKLVLQTPWALITGKGAG